MLSKRFRSLQWRLQAWHALILLAVITGFGAILHWEFTRSQWDAVDEELLTAARILDGALREVPKTILQSISRDIASPPGPIQRPPIARPPLPSDRNGFEKGPPPPPPRDLRREDDRELRERVDTLRNPGPDFVWDQSSAGDLREVDLPSTLPAQLGRGEGLAYYVIWKEDGTILKQANVPNEPPRLPRDFRQRSQGYRYWPMQRFRFREIFVHGVDGSVICVAIYAIGLLGGWYFTRRALEPIRSMSETARSIDIRTLSSRMDLEGIDVELEGLGNVLNQMLDRIEGSVEQQQRFISDASHELRTPLTLLLSNIELALSRSRTPQEYREHLDKSLRGVQRMRGLCESLLMLARLDSDASPTDHVVVNTQTMVRDAVLNLQSLASAKEIMVEDQSDEHHIRGDSTQLTQVFTNLIANAIQYNVPKGRVIITSGESRSARQSISDGVGKPEVWIRVQDTGVGIPPDAIPHLTERFFRVDQHRSRSGQSLRDVGDAGHCTDHRTDHGTGLGLSICDQILKSHGGRLEIESQVGAGSSFTVFIPLEVVAANE
jgi:two-component system, OmpR family, sensor kinase